MALYLISLFLWSFNSHSAMGFFQEANQSFQEQNKECNYLYDYFLFERVYVSTDKPPFFPGGEILMNKFILKNLQYTGEIAESRIDISLIVDIDGTLKMVYILDKQVDQYTDLDLAYLNVFRRMPKWQPGECSGKVVAVKMQIGINF